MKKLKIYYDGFCPFCTSYVRLQRIREHYDVELNDLRENKPKVKEFLEAGLNLDKGMVVEFEGTLFAGSEAVFLITTLQNNSVLGTLWKLIFFNKIFTKILYPLLVIFRNITLFILGRPKLKD